MNKNDVKFYPVTQEGKHVHVGIYPDREEAEAAIAIFRQSHEYTQRHGER